jgi:hypothetical protein
MNLGAVVGRTKGPGGPWNIRRWELMWVVVSPTPSVVAQEGREVAPSTPSVVVKEAVQVGPWVEDDVVRLPRLLRSTMTYKRV